MNTKKLTRYIGIAMVLGIVVGYVCNKFAQTPEGAKQIASYFSLVTDIFLRMIKMIIAPLVFATLVTGLASMSDASAVGRIGMRAMIWFIAASAISLLLGLKQAGGQVRVVGQHGVVARAGRVVHQAGRQRGVEIIRQYQAQQARWRGYADVTSLNHGEVDPGRRDGTIVVNGQGRVGHGGNSW